MIEIATSPTTTTVTVSGDLDLAERGQFPEVTARVSGLRRQLLVIDLCEATFLDSTGAAFLISLADTTARHGGTTVLRGADDRELVGLEICGALDSCRIDPTHRCEQRASCGRARPTLRRAACDGPGPPPPGRRARSPAPAAPDAAPHDLAGRGGAPGPLGEARDDVQPEAADAADAALADDRWAGVGVLHLDP